MTDTKTALNIAYAFNEEYHFKTIYGERVLGLKEGELKMFIGERLKVENGKGEHEEIASKMAIKMRKEEFGEDVIKSVNQM